ncbi:MAG TPA: lipid A deacylase LpxR family protein [Azospirillum sp.]
MAVRGVRVWLLAVLAQVGLFASPATAQTIGFWLDNDLFSGSDRYYTNGVQFYYLSRARPELGVMDWLADRVPGGLPEPAARRYGFALGQNIYTPEDTRRRELIRDDRPYAGWLYGRLSLLSEAPRRVDRIDIDLGVVGPASLAEPTQKAVHRVVPGAVWPEGWRNQLRNEPGVVLSYERVWRDERPGTLGPFQADVSPHAAFAVGNVLTFAGGGATVRLGGNMPPPVGALVMRPTTALPYEDADPARFSWYVYAAAEARLVARNIFLDGNSFVSSHGVRRIPVVGSAQLGVTVRYGRLGVTYAHNLLTPEFEGQKGIASFGSVRVTLQF